MKNEEAVLQEIYKQRSNYVSRVRMPESTRRAVQDRYRREGADAIGISRTEAARQGTAGNAPSALPTAPRPQANGRATPQSPRVQPAAPVTTRNTQARQTAAAPRPPQRSPAPAPARTPAPQGRAQTRIEDNDLSILNRWNFFR